MKSPFLLSSQKPQASPSSPGNFLTSYHHHQNNQLFLFWSGPQGSPLVSFWTSSQTLIWWISSSETQGQSVGSKKAGRKFASRGKRAPGYRLWQNYFQKFKQMSAPNWAQKNALYFSAQAANSFSRVLFVSLYTTAIVSIRDCLAHAPKKCTQSGDFQFDIKSPSDFKILSARKLNTPFFSKIQAWAYNRYSRLHWSHIA